MYILIKQKAISLKCQRCQHSWYYKGRNKYDAPCPHCRTYVTIKKSRILLVGKEAKPKQSVEPDSITSIEATHNHG